MERSSTRAIACARVTSTARTAAREDAKPGVDAPCKPQELLLEAFGSGLASHHP